MAGSRNCRRLAIAVLSSLALLLGAMTTAGPATAAPAAPNGLIPGNVSVTGTPILQWNAVMGATNYDVQVSASSDFATVLWGVTTTNVKATPIVHLPKGVVWWRVRATNSTGSGPWSLTSFDRSSVAGPTLLSPSPGIELSQPSDPALLSWTPVAGATGYTVEISTDPNLTDPALTKSYTTKTSSMVIPSPQVATSYYWHVRGTLGAGIFTEWSEIRAYSISGLSKPALVGPDDGSKVDDVVLDWRPVPGAKTYDVQVSTDINFLTLETASSPVGVTGTRYSPPTTLGNDQYYWRVRPVDAMGNKLDWSKVDVWQFQRHWPEQPHLEFPVGGISVGDPFYYQWTPVKLASSYTVQLSKTADFNSGDIVGTCTTVHTTFTPKAGAECWPGAANSYYWRVIAKDDPKGAVTDKIVAEHGFFTYQPELVSLTSPSAGAAVQVPTLRWEPVAGAENYKVTITPMDGGMAPSPVIISSTSFTPRDLLTVGKTYRWQVQTSNSDGRTGTGTLVSSQPSFTVAPMSAATETSPEPLSPADGSTSLRFPTLTWQRVVGASSYRILIRPAGSTAGFTRLPAKFQYPAGEDGGATWFSAGNYEWKVEAYNSSGTIMATSSSSRTFRIDNLPPVTGLRVALTGEATATAGSFCNVGLPQQCQDLRQTPVLRWYSQPDAGYYQVYISRDQEMTNLVTGPVRVESNMWMPANALIDSQAGSAFYWFVQPCKSGGKCAPLAHATNAFNKISNPVELEAPADGEKVMDEVTLRWRDYLTTNSEQSGDKLDDTGVNSRIEAKQYRVQVSTDVNFQSAVETILVDQTTFTSFTTTYPEGLVYWRVQAMDGSGNYLAWSKPRSFLKESPAPTLRSPLNGTKAAGNEPFVWQPLDFAAGYDIEVYKNGDKTGSSANLVRSGYGLQQVAFTPTTPLPVASSPYTWRVRRVDAKGRKGAWSKLDDPASAFVVVGQSPTLVTPSEGSTVQGNAALFTWQPPDATSTPVTSYRFERRAVGSSTLTEAVTTSSLAWAPTTTIPAGSWEWRVIALDAGGAALGTTAWRPLTAASAVAPPPTDTTRPKVIYKSPQRTAYRTANFLAKFSEPVKGVGSRTMRLYRKGSTTSLRAVVSLSTDGKTAKLNPNRNLRVGKYYVLKLRSGITDLSGNTLAATSWTVRAK